MIKSDNVYEYKVSFRHRDLTELEEIENTQVIDDILFPIKIYNEIKEYQKEYNILRMMVIWEASINGGVHGIIYFIKK